MTNTGIQESLMPFGKVFKLIRNSRKPKLNKPSKPSSSKKKNRASRRKQRGRPRKLPPLSSRSKQIIKQKLMISYGSASKLAFMRWRRELRGREFREKLRGCDRRRWVGGKGKNKRRRNYARWGFVQRALGGLSRAVVIDVLLAAIGLTILD